MKEINLIEMYKEMKSIKAICDELNINYSNLLNEKTTNENEKKVVDKIIFEILKVYSVIKLWEGNNGQ